MDLRGHWDTLKKSKYEIPEKQLSSLKQSYDSQRQSMSSYVPIRESMRRPTGLPHRKLRPGTKQITFQQRITNTTNLNLSTSSVSHSMGFANGPPLLTKDEATILYLIL